MLELLMLKAISMLILSEKEAERNAFTSRILRPLCPTYRCSWKLTKLKKTKPRPMA